MDKDTITENEAMPELPEAETIKRQLEAAVLGKKIVGALIKNAAVIREPSPQRFIQGLTGAAITKILRKGKGIILELSNGKFLVVHLRMTGQFLYPGTGRLARVSFQLSDSTFLDYNDRRLLGELRLVASWQAMAFFREMGPEIYDITPAEFSRMLTGKTTKIKPLLLDQTFLSGVGNLYAAEALFRARIHPARPARSLSESEKQLLFKEIRDTLNEAILHKGSSVDQYVQLSGAPGGYAKYHKVYGRENKPCVVCKEKISRISLGGRGTYFCPRCQH